MANSSFIDTSSDELDLSFNGTTGSLEVDGCGVSSFQFDAETSLDLAKWLVDQINTLTPLPLVDEIKDEPRTLGVDAGGSSARESFNLTAFQAAKELGLSVKFNYSKGNTGSIEPRDLAEVEKVETTSKGHLIVNGYDEDREEPRTFRVDWIKGFVEVTD